MTVVNDPSRQLHLATLTIDHLLRIGDFLFQCRRVGHKLERGARLVHITDRMVLQQAGRRVTKVIRVEGRANGQRENLSRVRILYNHGSIQGMGACQRSVERALRHELNIFIDGQHQVLPGIWFVLLAFEHMTAGIERGEHAAGNAMQIAIEAALHAAQTVVISADISQDLRAQLAIRIKTLELFLEIDALEVKRLHPRDHRRVKLASDPRKIAGGVEPGGNLVGTGEAIGGISVNHFCQGVRDGLTLLQSFRILPVSDFRRHGVYRIRQHRHR